jgi:hypothetical protein
MRRRARATYEGSAREVNRTDGGRERKKEDIRGDVNLDFDPGDEKARVTATRGFKSWFSTREAGLTVEATVSVTVKCDQRQDAIELAVVEAGKCAEQLSKKGIEDMGLYLDDFNKYVSR